MNHYLPILMFHAIDDAKSALCYPPGQFNRAMKRLHEEGYQTLRLSELATMQREKRPLPEKAVVLTFDDGYQSVYDHAWPVLQQLAMTATIFLLPEKATHVEMPLLSWDRIQEMHHGGIDFGAHSLTHPNMPKLPDDRIEHEMSESKKLIADKLGSEVSSFAYPFGSYDDRCREIASRHFQCACCDDLGLMTGQSDLFALPRIEMYYLSSERTFDLMFTSVFPWYLRVRNFPRRIRKALVIK